MIPALFATAATFGVSIGFCGVWSLLKAPARRHNQRAAANARMALAQMGVECPDELAPCWCEACMTEQENS